MTEAAASARTLEARRRPFADILCAVDGTRPSFVAVEQAAELAGPEGGLTLLAVTAPRGSGRFHSAVLNVSHAERVIERAAQIAERRGVSYTSLVDPGGPPSAVILERAHEHDLLAIGAPSHAMFGSLGASVAAEVLHAFSTPLLLAHPASRTPLTASILLASDGSDGSDPLVELAAELAGERCERVVLVHALGVESQAHPHRIEAQRQLLTRRCGQRAKAVIEPGDPCELIEAVADAEGSTIAVVGSRRLTGLGAVLGSVSRRVVRSLGCPVLLIPPAHLCFGSPA
jgi:nucleotide-binding universal stress UspA family protein